MQSTKQQQRALGAVISQVNSKANTSWCSCGGINCLRHEILASVTNTIWVVPPGAH